MATIANGLVVFGTVTVTAQRTVAWVHDESDRTFADNVTARMPTASVRSQCLVTPYAMRARVKIPRWFIYCYDSGISPPSYHIAYGANYRESEFIS